MIDAYRWVGYVGTVTPDDVVGKSGSGFIIEKHTAGGSERPIAINGIISNIDMTRIGKRYPRAFNLSGISPQDIEHENISMN
jgi:hypothetical protein